MEALVVALIIGVLSAVAVPMYSGYIKNQRKQAVASVAQTAAVTATSLYRRNNVVPTSAQLNAALSLPNPAAFTITVETADGINFVRVVDAADTECKSEVVIK